MMQKYAPMMITCREFEDFIFAYMDDSLPKRQRFIFDLHIKVCRECHDYLAAYKRTTEISKRVFEDLDAAVPADVPEDLVKAILAAKEA